MKAVIPAAGAGTRLRPHTLNKPKALLPVAGRPILAHIVDDLAAAGIDSFVVVVGHHGQAVRDWFAAERPDLDIACVEQERRLGLGHAIWTAREAVADQPFYCVLGDTILEADHGALLAGPDSAIGVCRVADPRRFGVATVAGERVTGCVEKPAVPSSDLAMVGAYLFRDGAALMAALEGVIGDRQRTGGEYQLAAGLQRLLARGHVFRAVEVSGWHDCGERETWLQSNRALLDRDGAGEAGAMGPRTRVSGSRLGPHVSVGADVEIEDCEIRDAVIGAGSVLRGCRLHGSLVGEQCHLEGVVGAVNVGDFCELTAKEQG